MLIRNGETSAKDEEVTNKNGRRIYPHGNSFHGCATIGVVHSTGSGVLICAYKLQVNNDIYGSSNARLIIILYFFYL